MTLNRYVVLQIYVKFIISKSDLLKKRKKRPFCRKIEPFVSNFLVFCEQTRSETLCTLDCLIVLPLSYELRIAAEQYIRHSPAVELCRSCVNRSGKETVLEAVAECGGLI